MKRLVLTEPGLTLEMIDRAVDAPAPHEIQVAVTAVGLNPIDGKLARSGHPQWRYPHTPGLDAVGYITQAGSRAGNFRPEQRVLWHGDLRRDGALAQIANVPAQMVTPISDEIDDLCAAALPCSGITAWQAIERMQLTSKQTVLIEAGAGGVGYYAIQLAKKKGARVVTTASLEHHQFLGAIGADRTIDYRNEDVAARIRETGSQLDAVLDSIGGATSARDMALLRRGGQFVSLLGMPDVGGVDLFTLAPSIHLIGVGGAHRAGDGAVRELVAIADKLITLLAEGELQCPSIEPIPFTTEAVTGALQRELEGSMPGKQVVVVG